ncbi:rod shape-determining protein MreC [Hydrogenimonas urashimensis]|uniref:rod shape-determining protein MreC n=1 Tax=Hydrogenimonas urashimensis TaxID=2740515 RepID=UPI0019155FF7|nr:rod shape-determining protein MreC [Hydrogenimonas urashimensis]
MNRFHGKIHLFLIAAAVAGLIFYSPAVRNFFTAFSSTVQSTYFDTKKEIEDAIARHLMQAATIESLQTKEKNLEKELILCRSDARKFHAISESLHLRPDTNLSIMAVRAKGYALLGNFQQLWLEDFPEYNPMKNYGVIRAGFAIGIVVEEKRRPLMILAGDKACNFAVYIGKNRAPGIAMGKDAKHMVVKYIPEWMKLNIGDRVYTSGLDQIFPIGVPVGRVLSVRNMQGFKNAEILLFGDTLHPDYVWVVAR